MYSSGYGFVAITPVKKHLLYIFISFREEIIDLKHDDVREEIILLKINIHIYPIYYTIYTQDDEVKYFLYALP